jgi:streptogramin lyase
MRLISKTLLCLALASGTATAAIADVTTPAGAQPESLTVAPDGDVILGSASSPKIYRAKPGAAATVWIDVSKDFPQATFLGVLADAPANTLWACQINNGTPAEGRKATLRGFDLKTGAAKSSWSLPGDVNLCNDMVVAADGSLYVTDTFTGRLHHVNKNGTEGTTVLDNMRLMFGIDGIAFLDGKLYVNTVFAGNLYRIDFDAQGKARPVEIFMDKLVKNPDGMREAGGRLYVAENGSGKVHYLTISGDTAKVTVFREGLKTPTGVQPHGNTIWVPERGADKGTALPVPK